MLVDEIVQIAHTTGEEEEMALMNQFTNADINFGVKRNRLPATVEMVDAITVSR